MHQRPIEATCSDRLQPLMISPCMSYQYPLRKNVGSYSNQNLLMEYSLSSESSSMGTSDLDMEVYQTAAGISIPQGSGTTEERRRHNKYINTDFLKMNTEVGIDRSSETLPGGPLQLHQDLDFVGGQFPAPADTHYQVPHYGLLEISTLAGNPALSHPYVNEYSDLDHESHIDCSSEYQQADFASSYSPTTGFYPESQSTNPGHVDRPRSITMANPQNIASRPKQHTSSHRRRHSNSTHSATRKPGILKIIPEDGQRYFPFPMSREGPQRGRRKGPLSNEAATKAAQRRKEKNVCIRCRTLREPVTMSRAVTRKFSG